MQVLQSPSGRPVTREDGTGLGLADGPGFMSAFADAFTKVAPSIATIYTTQATLKSQENMARMQMQQGGMQPGQVGTYYPSTAQMSPLSGMTMPLLLGGVALAAVLLLKK